MPEREGEIAKKVAAVGVGGAIANAAVEGATEAVATAAATNAVQLVRRRLSLEIGASLGDLLTHAKMVEADIAQMKRKAKALGWSAKQLAEQIEIALNTIKSHASNAVDAVVQAGSVLNDMWNDSGGDLSREYVWQAVSNNVCVDCAALHGTKKTMGEWLESGLPGSGHTVCGPHCQCLLVTPEKVTEKPIRLEREKGPRGGRGRIVAIHE